MSLISTEFVFPQKSFETRNDALHFLAEALHKGGRVKDSYYQAILDREKIFPTGLPTGVIGVAIPHANPENVNTSTLAVATLTKPVTFQNMGDPTQSVSASIIIMLAIAEPKGQVTMLQKLMSIVQNQEHLAKLLSYQDQKDLANDLDSTFSDVKLA